jgi:pyruvate dehydrogenase E1 component alpha subunit
MNCRTYRVLGHYVGDSGEQYRTKEEVEKAKKRDPVNLLRGKLIEMDVLTDDKAQEIEAEIDKQMDDAVKFAQDSPSPTAEDLMTDVYSE